MKKIIMLAAVAAFTLASPAMAAKDGKLSKNNSVGKLDITAVIPPMVRVSGLDDLRINVTPADLLNPYFNRQDAETKFCVYSNINAEGEYNITVDGDAAGPNSNGSPFALSGAGGKLNYAVWVSDDVNNGFRSAGSGWTYPGYTHTGYKTTAGGLARPASISCSDVGENAALHIGIDNSQILAAQAGKYKGTLTVTVSTI
ncbi:MAG: hypothetical protein JWO15_1565 [Sphingomonadales bacterium]|nr:hypothetical protein [Sphingomonadales bacterium]